jgi:hypothetical protein
MIPEKETRLPRICKNEKCGKLFKHDNFWVSVCPMCDPDQLRLHGEPRRKYEPREKGTPPRQHLGKNQAFTGQVIDQVKVIKQNHKDEYGRPVWLCECVCEKQVLRSTTVLDNGLRHGLRVRCSKDCPGAKKKKAVA